VKRALLSCLLALACGRTQLSVGSPQALVDATTIDFGQTPVLFPVQRTLVVRSAGFATLHIASTTVTGVAFSGSTAALDVAAGATVSLPLTFTPPASGAFQGSVTLAVDDPEQPTVTVALIGTGTQPGSVAVTPAVLDFGRVGEGRTVTRALKISSGGPADLFLASLGFAAGTPSAFGYVGSVATPAVLAAGNELSLAVHFSPTPVTQLASGALAIVTSDPLQPVVQVPLTAQINRAPVAVASGSVNGGAPQLNLVSAQAGAIVQLDGSASDDPDGDLPLAFSWTLTTRPAGSAAALSSSTTLAPVLSLDVAGIYSVQLEVTDATGLPSFAPARLDIQALPQIALLVELTWDQIPPDLDLHFLQSGAALNSAGDCYWANASPAFGPHHDGDALVGYGPELVEWTAPAAGSYALQVVYSAAHGAAKPATNAQLRIFSQGVLAGVLTHAFGNAGETWDAGTLSWPGGVVVGAAP
jgi:hypothetical protein